MPRELSTEARAVHLKAVQAVARGNGGECLAKVYVTAKTKLPFRCAEGHEWEATTSNVRHYSWCPVCAMARRSKKR